MTRQEQRRLLLFLVRASQPRSFYVRLFAESFLRGKFGISSYNSTGRHASPRAPTSLFPLFLLLFLLPLSSLPPPSFLSPPRRGTIGERRIRVSTLFSLEDMQPRSRQGETSYELVLSLSPFSRSVFDAKIQTGAMTRTRPNSIFEFATKSAILYQSAILFFFSIFLRTPCYLFYTEISQVQSSFQLEFQNLP